MASKMIFTTCSCILFDRNPGVDPVATALTRAGYQTSSKLAGDKDPLFMSDFVRVPYRPDVLGYVYIDVLDQPWPDSLGFPVEPNQPKPEVENWKVGCFGPTSYPFSLERAARNNFSWQEASKVPQRHSAVVRIRTSYMLGGQPNQPHVPSDYDPIQELSFVAAIAAAVSQTPGAIAYFNPSGECLHPVEMLPRHIQLAVAGELPPIGLLTSIRVFDLSEKWVLMDTVGNGQYAHPSNPVPMQDFEVCIPKEGFDFQATATMLTYATTMLIRNGPSQGYQGNGAIVLRKFGLATPPRPTVRWFHGTPTEELLAEYDRPIVFA